MYITHYGSLHYLVAVIQINHLLVCWSKPFFGKEIDIFVGHQIL